MRNGVAMNNIIKKNKNPIAILLLLLIGSSMVWYVWESGTLFGSTTDWLCQHMAFAKTFQENFLATHDLFPDFLASLGCGQNIYHFSYYGLFRPDVIFAGFFPNIDIAIIMSVYFIGLYLVGAVCLYGWIRSNKGKASSAFLVSVLYLMSSVLFQSHRQIMFVDYMPFLILALWGVDRLVEKKRTELLSVASFFMIIHSYYFSVTGLVVCLIYFIYRKKSWKTLLHFILGCGLGINAAGILLIPTAVAMLSNGRGEQEGVSLWDIFLPGKEGITNILYQPYGCGLTIFVLIMLLFGIWVKKYRKLSITLLLFFILPLASFMLNGMLYIRSKVFICFIPLILYVSAFVWTELVERLQKKWKKSKKNLKKWSMIFPYAAMFLILCEAVTAAVIVNEKETYVTKESYYKLINSEGSSKNTKAYRVVNVAQPMQAANLITNEKEKKTTVYSSISNKYYDDFWKNTLKNPQSTRNSLALTGGENVFSKMLLSEKTVYGKKGVVKENQVFPIAYMSNDFINEKEFDELEYPYTLDTMIHRTVVESNSDNSYLIHRSGKYESQLKKIHIPKKDQINQIDIKEKKTKIIACPKAEDIVVLSFMVTTKEAKDVCIRVNGITEKLSSYKAPYPNENHLFSYVIENSEPYFSIEFEPGTYTISDWNVYTCSKEVINQALNRIQMVTFLDTKKKEVLHLDAVATEPAYLVTSIPYDTGMKGYVDGKAIKIERVNEAFCGILLERGQHEVVLSYHAKGKELGKCSSMIGVIGIFFLGFVERERTQYKDYKKERKDEKNE